jgi:surface antigen
MARSISMRAFACLLIVALCGAGCATGGDSTMEGNKKTILGSMAGAAAGGLIGAAAGGGAAGIVGGVLLGGLIGGVAGNALDQRDKQIAAANAQRTFESAKTGQTTTWQNPDSGHSGTITPTHTYQAASGQYCREYQQEIVVGGEKHQSYGTACRQPDGSWKIQN